MALTRIGLNQSINLASNVTGTLPVANGGTALTSGFVNGGVMTPAFEAVVASNQSLTDATTTKVIYGSEVYDTDNCYDSSTNYRFTPTTAGKYFVYASAYCDGEASDNLEVSDLTIYKNGSYYSRSYNYFHGSPIRLYNNFVSATIDFNGSSDYVEIFVLVDDSTSNPKLAAPNGYRDNKFGAFKIIE